MHSRTKENKGLSAHASVVRSHVATLISMYLYIMLLMYVWCAHIFSNPHLNHPLLMCIHDYIYIILGYVPYEYTIFFVAKYIAHKQNKHILCNLKVMCTLVGCTYILFIYIDRIEVKGKFTPKNCCVVAGKNLNYFAIVLYRGTIYTFVCIHLHHTYI